MSLENCAQRLLVCSVSLLLPHFLWSASQVNGLHHTTPSNWIYEPNCKDQVLRIGLEPTKWGRDVFSRLLVGTKVASYLAVTAVSISLAIGIFLGMIAAFTSRWIDWSMLLIFDTVRSFPTLMFALAVIALFGPSINTIIGIIVISTFPSYARLVRTQVLSLRSMEYIEAQRAMGTRLPRILMRHIFPNVIGPVMIVASMDIPLVIGVEAGFELSWSWRFAPLHQVGVPS
jgi:peptide/nickel transport system permease protein